MRETEINEREKKMAELNDKRKIERKTNFYAKASEVKRAFFLNKPMIVLLYKETLFNTNQLDIICLVQLSLFCRNLKISFPRKFQKGYLLSEGSNIKLILCWVLPFRTDPLIGVIPMRQRNSKSKLVN